MKRRKTKIFATLIVAVLLIPSVYAATLCSYKGPDTSEHDLQLSDFLVSGDSPVRVGDKVSVEFKLTNVGKYAVTFDDKYGVFVAAKDPDGKSTSFGSTYQGKTLKPKEFMTLKTDITLDKEGAWTLWASYCIKTEKGTICGPEGWHSCRIKVETKPTPTPTPTVTPSPTPVCPEGCACLTEEEATRLGYSLCKGEKILCGYDKYQNPMYCYEKPAVTPTPTPVCPDGCVCLAEEEATRLGYVPCKGHEGKICRYGEPMMYCYEKPAVTPTPTPEACHYDYEKGECVGYCPAGQVCHLNTIYRDPATGKVTYAECTCKAPLPAVTPLPTPTPTVTPTTVGPPPIPSPSPIPMLMIRIPPEIYFADAGEVPGSVYHYNTTTGSESAVYTRSAERLYSFLFTPWAPSELYFVNANENKIYLAGTPEKVIYVHTTYVRDIAIGKDKMIYFSEATGAAANGKIWRLEPNGGITFFYEVKLRDIDGFWAGDFTFDKNGMLYLSSGNIIPRASIYKVDVATDTVTKIFTDYSEPIMGMTFGASDLLYYANWQTKIYCLDLTTGARRIIYEDQDRTWLSDVALPVREAPPIEVPPDVDLWIMPYAVGGIPLYNIKENGLTDYGYIRDAPFGSYLGFRHGYDNRIPTNGIKYYRWLYKHENETEWHEFTEPVGVHYVKEEYGRITFPVYTLGPKSVNGLSLYEFKPHNPPEPGTYWPTTDWFGDIYSGFLNSEALSHGKYKIKLEIYDKDGNQVMPGYTTIGCSWIDRLLGRCPRRIFTFIVPTGVDANDTVLTREALPGEIENGGFVFTLHIDNRRCNASIDAPRIDTTSVADACGFLRYKPTDTTVHIAFQATHPDNFATFSFSIVRGTVTVSSASGEVSASSAGVYNGDGYGNFAHDFSIGELLGTCSEAAFSENLYVYAKATNGWRRIYELDGSYVRAFALSPERR